MASQEASATLETQLVQRERELSLVMSIDRIRDKGTRDPEHRGRTLERHAGRAVRVAARAVPGGRGYQSLELPSDALFDRRGSGLAGGLCGRDQAE